MHRAMILSQTSAQAPKTVLKPVFRTYKEKLLQNDKIRAERKTEGPSYKKKQLYFQSTNLERRPGSESLIKMASASAYMKNSSSYTN